MIPVSSVKRVAEWLPDGHVGGTLVVQLGLEGSEVTVDEMLLGGGRGHAVFRADQLAHLLAGMLPRRGKVVLRGHDDVAQGHLLSFRQLLTLWGHAVELC